MSEFDEDLDQDVDNIIAQLKNQGKSITVSNIQKEMPDLQKEDIEKFIINNSSKVVTDCVEMISKIKDDLEIELNPRLIESAAGLVSAFTSALDTLTKLKLSDDKIKAQKEIKEMDIAGKLEISNNKEEKETKEGIYLSREEVIKGLMSYKDEPPVEPPAIDV